MKTLTRMEIPVFTESGLLQAHGFTVAKFACPGCRLRNVLLPEVVSAFVTWHILAGCEG